MKLVTLIFLLSSLNVKFVELLFIVVLSIVWILLNLLIAYGGLDAVYDKYLI